MKAKSYFLWRLQCVTLVRMFGFFICNWWRKRTKILKYFLYHKNITHNKKGIYLHFIVLYFKKKENCYLRL